jgi:hypothetical protein
MYQNRKTRINFATTMRRVQVQVQVQVVTSGNIPSLQKNSKRFGIIAQVFEETRNVLKKSRNFSRNPAAF